MHRAMIEAANRKRNEIFRVIKLLELVAAPCPRVLEPLDFTLAHWMPQTST